MTQIARLLVVVLIAAFAVWSTVQPAGATTMAQEMGTISHHGDILDAARCDGCASRGMDSKDNVHCHSVCTSPILADLTDTLETKVESRQLHVAVPVYDLVGRTYPPDPYPPRALLI